MSGRQTKATRTDVNPGSTFIVGPLRISQGGEVAVIAEIGVNHDGDATKAHRLIDAAADADCEIVKFQVFDPALLVSGQAETAEYQRHLTGESLQADLLSRLTLPHEAWSELAIHARERGLLFLATAFDSGSADLIQELGVPALKVPSGELTHHRFLRDLAARGLPLIISTGLATQREVDDAITVTSLAPARMLFHCVTAYPTPLGACNLRAIPSMATRSGLPVGWSDHTADVHSAVAAVTLGAPLLEKHLTLDRTAPGADHAASLEPDQFAEYVRVCRETHRALGNGDKRPADVELPNLVAARRSPHAARDLFAGHVLTEDDITFLRPMTGVGADIPLVGRKLAVDVLAGTPVQLPHLVEAVSGPQRD